jgi:hypothetical protein
MNNIVVYTAIYGNKDTVKQTQYRMSGVDYVLFTDNKNLKSDIWDIRYVRGTTNCHIRNARRIKILPHLWLGGYEKSIWIDGNIEIKKSLCPLLELNSRWLVFGHGRNCVYDEAVACILRKKDNKYVINKHIQHYKKLKYPAKNGLWSTGVMIRSHNLPEMIHLSELWWDEVRNRSRRDQISSPFVAWLSGVYPDYIDGVTGNIIHNNDWINILPHSKR